MHKKLEIFEKFQEYKKEVENQLGRNIKILRSDRGREYMLDPFSDFLKENGIIHQLTMSYTPQQMVLHNLVPTKIYNRTPHELWTGRKPNLQNLKVWGFFSSYINPITFRSQLDSKTIKGTLLHILKILKGIDLLFTIVVELLV